MKIEKLRARARRRGVQTRWTDVFGREHEVSAEALEAVLDSLAAGETAGEDQRHEPLPARSARHICQAPHAVGHPLVRLRHGGHVGAAAGRTAHRFPVSAFD